MSFIFCVFLAALSVANSVRIPAAACPLSCTSDLDCSLNGACQTGGVCSCDPGWTGRCCGALDLLPVNVSETGLGYRHPATSTWGGNIIIQADNSSSSSYHMWIAEMAPNGTAGDAGAGSCGESVPGGPAGAASSCGGGWCSKRVYTPSKSLHAGLTTWGSNSQITHVKSTAGYGGPYVRQEVAVPVWSHNPLVRAMPDSTLVMYHIGSGSGGPPKDGYCALNATSPCGEQSFDQCGAPQDPCSMVIPGYSCHAGYCSGDLAAAGDCGSDIAEPALACNGSWAGCVPQAASACTGNPGCNSFGMSSVWPAASPLKVQGEALHHLNLPRAKLLAVFFPSFLTGCKAVLRWHQRADR
jgi:hypothetical protein